MVERSSITNWNKCLLHCQGLFSSDSMSDLFFIFAFVLDLDLVD